MNFYLFIYVLSGLWFDDYVRRREFIFFLKI